MRRPYLLFAMLFALTMILIIVSKPRSTISPGDLLKGHEDISDHCFDCHSPFMGVSTEKCLSCHKLKDIGKKSTDGKTIIRIKGKSLDHQSLKLKDCGVCHTDHRGRDAKSSIGRFNHDSLGAMNAKACVTCHIKPKDSLHRRVVKACGECHSTKHWTPASFDHRSYFRFDRHHRTNCASCHLRNDYKTYTCYGCHEHSPRKVKREHLEEGIRDYQNCRKCHPSGDEDEAERIWKGLKRKSGGYRGGKYDRKRNKKTKHRRNHDGDDDEEEDDDDD